jgi:hypothetical protein
VGTLVRSKETKWKPLRNIQVYNWLAALLASPQACGRAVSRVISLRTVRRLRGG